MKYIDEKTYEFGVRFDVSIKDQDDLRAMLFDVYKEGAKECTEFVFNKKHMNKVHNDEETFLGTIYDVPIFAKTTDEVKIRQINKWLQDATDAFLKQ